MSTVGVRGVVQRVLLKLGVDSRYRIRDLQCVHLSGEGSTLGGGWPLLMYVFGDDVRVTVLSWGSCKCMS